MAQIKRYLADAEEVSERAEKVAGIRVRAVRIRALTALLRECEGLAKQYDNSYKACQMLRKDVWEAYADERAELARGTSHSRPYNLQPGY